MKKSIIKRLEAIITSLCICISMITLFPGIQFIKVSAYDANTAAALDKACDWAKAICNDDSHGYSDQWSIDGPDYACTTLIAAAFAYAGIPFTDNYRCEKWDTILPTYGFYRVDYNTASSAELQRGDIIWTGEHVELYIGNNKIAGANSYRNHPETGDQTGTEVYVKDYHTALPWICAFRLGGSVPLNDAPIAPYPRPSGSPLIQKGSTGAYVKWVQYTLNKQLGYDIGSAGVDGDFGAGTESAVKAFQKDNGLEVDGQVGPKTIEKIVKKVQSKKWYESLTPANLGNSFDAIILNKNCWKPIRPNSSSNVFLYKEEWTTGEMWRFTRQSNGSYRIVNFANGQSLDANGAGKTNGTNVGTYNSNDSNAQRWFIYGKNGGYVLRAECGDLVMDVEGNISADNTNIQLYTYHGGEAQVFSLYHSRGNSTVNDYAKPSPSAPTLSVKSDSSIALSWKSTAYTEKYIVYRSTDNSTWKKIGETTSTSYTDTGLTATTKYYYKIEAVNRFYTVSSPSASATTQAIPTYTVAFNSNSGSGTMSNQTINRDKATALTANNFTKTGYSFLGWSTDKSASKATYTDKQSVTNLAAGGGTATLYAIWKANTYKIMLDEGSGKTTVIDVTYDGKYNVPDAKKDGYHFAGWYTKTNGEGTLISKDTTVKITAAQTLYACWKKDVLAITFNANGGTTELTEKLVSYDTKYGYLPDATKQGYEFGGWYLDKALTQQITADSIVKITASQEVFAKWTQVVPTITFDAKGGTADMDTKQVVMGKNYGVLPDAEKAGCEFVGWFMEDGTEITPSSIVEKHGFKGIEKRYKSIFLYNNMILRIKKLAKVIRHLRCR